MISMSGCRSRNVIFICSGQSGFDLSNKANATCAVRDLPLQCQETKRVPKIESIYSY
jgi:hypothetical protein